jgi:hypothetical protein
MFANLVLLDIAPAPPSPGVGTGELILVSVVVLILTGAAIAGFVFLVRRLMKTADARTHLVVGDACLTLGSAGSRSNSVASPHIGPIVQPENSPNQP